MVAHLALVWPSCFSVPSPSENSQQVSPSPPSPLAVVERPETPTVVILVTVDGVMWQDIFEGSVLHFPDGSSKENFLGRQLLFPNLFRYGRAMGAPGYGQPILASGPNFVSLPGYTELFTGTSHTGCGNNFCDGAQVPTLADDIRSHAKSPDNVAVFSSWDLLCKAASFSSSAPGFVMSCGSVRAQGGEEVLRDDQAYVAGRRAPPWPGETGYRPDRFTADLALGFLKTHPHPRFVFVGLGDTDEFAHMGDRPRYEQAMRDADSFVGRVIDELQGTRAVIVVTADHGRAHTFRDHGREWPESSRVWLFAVVTGQEEHGFVLSPVPRHLADVAPTLRVLMGLPVPPQINGNGQAMPELLLFLSPQPVAQ